MGSESEGFVKGMMEWGGAQFFKFIHQNNLVYNTCWEDPRLDREALKINSKDNLLMITSAGCNALDYALDEPNQIFAVDMNPRQNALLDLKIAGIRKLDFETFFQIFGRGYIEDFNKIYSSSLRPELNVSARSYWDKNLDYFLPGKIRPTFYSHGTSGLFARAIQYYTSINRTRSSILSMFEAESIDEQQEIYKGVRTVFWNDFTRWMCRNDAALSLLGVPRPQRQQVEKGYVGGIAKFAEDCVESVFTRLPLKDNYFWWLYINGEYSKDRCPEYLREENFEKLKAGGVDCISTHTNSILDFLRFNDVEISKFVLLDHMDWLSTHSLQILADEWQAMLKSASQGARFLWRSGGLDADFIDPLQVVFNGMSRSVGDLLNYNADLASQLHKRDRVHTYGSFYIADLVTH